MDRWSSYQETAAASKFEFDKTLQTKGELSCEPEVRPTSYKEKIGKSRLKNRSSKNDKNSGTMESPIEPRNPDIAQRMAT